MKNIFKNISASGLIILFLTQNLFAGSTGKIIGKITDAANGEPLVGANVIVTNTMLEVTTDIEGKYAIIGVPIGVHTVKVSMVGFQEVIINGVKVNPGQTTPINIVKASADHPTVITVNRLVNPFATSSVQTLSAQEIEQIPNIKSVEDVVALQAGVVKIGNQLFLRGGRANEVLYVIDGIPVNNIIRNYGEFPPLLFDPNPQQYDGSTIRRGF